MKINSPASEQSQKNSFLSRPIVIKRRFLGLRLLGVWIVLFIWFGFIFASMYPQIIEVKSLRESYKNQVAQAGVKNVGDTEEVTSALIKNPLFYRQTQAFGQNLKDADSGLEKEWNAMQFQRPVAYFFLDYGCLTFTFGVIPRHVIGMSAFWPGITVAAQVFFCKML